MHAVGRLSNYISQGVYTVAAPFHPFGGAVDIIVVQQEDGTFKCSPWYVKFGKFQGVLKRREKIVTVAVNGEEAGFHMYLDNKGEAFFWKEVESDDEETSIFSPPSAQSSSDEVAMEQQSSGRRVSFKEDALKDEEKLAGDALTNSPLSDGIMVSENKEETVISFYKQTSNSDEKQMENVPVDINDSQSPNSIAKNGVKNTMIVSKTPSRRRSLFNYVFRRSKRFSESEIMSDTDQSDGQYEGKDIIRRSSLERAEIVANLLDSKWATGNKPNKEENVSEKSMEMNLFSSSSGDSPDKEETVDEKLVANQSLSNSSASDALPHERTREKTNSDNASSSGSANNEETVGERPKEMNLFSNCSGHDSDKEEILGEKSVGMNPIYGSSADDAQPLEQMKEVTTSNDACLFFSSANDSVGSIKKQIYYVRDNDSKKTSESKIKDSSQVLCNCDVCLTAENYACGNQMLEHSIQLEDPETYQFSAETEIFSMEGSFSEFDKPGQQTSGTDVAQLEQNSTDDQETEIFSMEGSFSEFDKLGQQTSGTDVAQLEQNSTDDQEYMNCQNLSIPDPGNPHNVVTNVESCLGTFDQFSQQTFANDVAPQLGNSSCDQEQLSTPQLKTLNSVESSSGSIDALLTCMADSQDAIATHISSLDLASEASSSSFYLQDASPNSEKSVKSEVIIDSEEVVDDAHMEFNKYSSDQQEQMEQKELQEEDMWQIIPLVKPNNSSSDCNTSILFPEMQLGRCYLSGSLLETGDCLVPCADLDRATMKSQQVQNGVIEPIIGSGDDGGEQNDCKIKPEEVAVIEGIPQKELDRSLFECDTETENRVLDHGIVSDGGEQIDCRIKPEELAVIEGIPQKELDGSLCECDTETENRVLDHGIVSHGASHMPSWELYLVGDPDTCTESNEGRQNFQHMPDITVKPVIEGRNDETEKCRSSPKTDEEANIPVMPPKELVGAFCNFDILGDNRANEDLASERIPSYTNPQEDMDVAITCNNMIDDKLDDTSRLKFQMQYDLSSSLSVSKHYKVHKLGVILSNNSFVKTDECCVQTKETYSTQTVTSESREDLELTFNDEYVLNGCLALSELSSHTKEGTREHSVPFLTEQVEEIHRQTGNNYQSEELAFSVQLHDGHQTISSLNVNGTNVKDDYNFEHSNGDVSQISRAEAIPIDICGLHMEDRGDAIKESGSLPNLGNHFSDIEKANADCLYSRSLDSNPNCLKQAISQENHFPDLQNTEARTFEKETVHDWATREASTESLKIWNVTATAIARVQPYTGIELSLCRHLLFEGMGIDAASQAFDSFRVSAEHFHDSGPAIAKNEKLVVKIGGHYFPWDAAASIILQMVAFGLEGPVKSEGAINVDRVEKALEKYASDSFVPSPGGWKIWHSLFRRSKVPHRSFSAPGIPRNDLIGEPQVALRDSFDGSLNDYYRKNNKRKMRSNIPSSEQLASLNLKEGQNIITFTFSTRVLGKQQVDARIYLWKWNTRIVVSDVDGTITKSDVLGQFMPLVGKDWTQSGVAHLFSAIKDNGYQLLFLSARAIAQAYLTRQFLLNIKQDGKALPDGPIVISPDGLFPSLYREVIRRAPHEFKIACLEDIRKLFPRDSNPFYAGFGNRNTDEISYLKVGIPKGKIFIINPKGEIVVNHHVDTKSYTSLHTLVNGMFPAMSSSEQEDYNSWNYWKTPIPDIDV